LLYVLFSNLDGFGKKNPIVLVVRLTHVLIFEKRAANLIRMRKITFLYVKIGFWILTTNFTKTALLNEERKE
jgi:hypothetical protein